MGIEFQQQEEATPIDPNEAEGLIPALSTQGELNEFEAQHHRRETVGETKPQTERPIGRT